MSQATKTHLVTMTCDFCGESEVTSHSDPQHTHRWQWIGIEMNALGRTHRIHFDVCKDCMHSPDTIPGQTLRKIEKWVMRTR